MAEPVNVSYQDTGALGVILENLHGLSRVGWGSLNLNRDGTRLSTPAMAQKRVEHPHVGFTWNSGDSSTSKWYPQGVSGLRNSSGSKKFLVVSWYGKGSYEHKGARLSFVDVTDMDAVRYRHVLLVQTAHPSRGFRPIKFHAGGIATRSNYLYIADTHHGVRVFNVARMYRAQPNPAKNRCGIYGGVAYAYNYRYVLPQVGRYRLKGPPRFSYASMDRSQGGDGQLVMGNYHNPPNYDNPPATLAWWHMDGTKVGPGLRQTVTLPRRVQGAASRGDQIWLSCSGGNATLKVARYPFEEFRSHTWPHGCEDLHLSPYSGNLWCHTEHTNERIVFAVKADDYTP